MKPSAKWIAVLAAGSTLLLTLAACSASVVAPRGGSAPSASAVTGTITVYGAASLTATFTELAVEFEKANPGVTVQTTFNGSSILVTQIQSGAPADVFASADTANMAKLATAGLLAGAPLDFATNVLEIAVPKGNPANIKTFTDLARPGVKTVICAPTVPCGAATVAVQAATGVTLAPVSEETAVTAVLTKVRTGQADAGLVYVTDVTGAAATVEGIPFAEAGTAVNTYPIAVLKASSNAAAATAFVKFVTGPAGQRALTAAGFGTPR